MNLKLSDIKFIRMPDVENNGIWKRDHLYAMNNDKICGYLKMTYVDSKKFILRPNLEFIDFAFFTNKYNTETNMIKKYDFLQTDDLEKINSYILENHNGFNQIKYFKDFHVDKPRIEYIRKIDDEETMSLLGRNFECVRAPNGVGSLLYILGSLWVEERGLRFHSGLDAGRTKDGNNFWVRAKNAGLPVFTQKIKNFGGGHETRNFFKNMTEFVKNNPDNCLLRGLKDIQTENVNEFCLK